MEAFLRDARPYYESIGDVTMRFEWNARDDHQFREIFEYASAEAFEIDDHRVNHDPEMLQYLARWRTFLEGEISVSAWNEVEMDLQFEST